MRQLIYLASARRDLLEIIRYIAREGGSPRSGQQFGQALTIPCRALAASPFLPGRARPELSAGLRSLAYRRHVIFFLADEQRLTVVNILHGMRDLPAFFQPDP